MSLDSSSALASSSSRPVGSGAAVVLVVLDGAWVGSSAASAAALPAPRPTSATTPAAVAATGLHRMRRTYRRPRRWRVTLASDRYDLDGNARTPPAPPTASGRAGAQFRGRQEAEALAGDDAVRRLRRAKAAVPGRCGGISQWRYPSAVRSACSKASTATWPPGATSSGKSSAVQPGTGGGGAGGVVDDQEQRRCRRVSRSVIARQPPRAARVGRGDGVERGRPAAARSADDDHDRARPRRGRLRAEPAGRCHRRRASRARPSVASTPARERPWACAAPAHRPRRHRLRLRRSATATASRSARRRRYPTTARPGGAAGRCAMPVAAASVGSSMGSTSRGPASAALVPAKSAEGSTVAATATRRRRGPS